MKRRKIDIGVLGHYGNENLGDEAIVAAVVENLRRRLPQAQICGFSMRPSDTTRRHGIPAHPLRRIVPRPDTMTDGPSTTDWTMPVRAWIRRWPAGHAALRAARRAFFAPLALGREIGFLARSFPRVRGVRLVLIAGSGQFWDGCGGAWAFPYTLAKWSVLARLAGTRVAVVSVGVGPVDSAIGRRLLRLCLRLSDYRSLRDEDARRQVEAFGFRGSIDVVPDLALSLSTDGRETARGPDRPSGVLPTVGINPLPFHDPRYWTVPDEGRYQAYVRLLAAFAAELLRRGHPIFFFPTQRQDRLTIADVLRAMGPGLVPASRAADLVRDVRSVEALLTGLSSADLVVASRFHGVTLSLLLGRPVLGLCYHRKTSELMQQVGQAAYALDLDGLTPAQMIATFTALHDTAAEAARTIRLRTPALRVALDRQYDALLALL